MTHLKKQFFIFLAFAILVFGALPVVAGEPPVTLRGDITPGSLVVGQTVPDARVNLGNRPLRVSPQGLFVFGFHREVHESVELVITMPDGQVKSLVLAPPSRVYKTQQIEGLPGKMVTPPKDLLDRISRERKMIRQAWKMDTPQTWFSEGFSWPLRGPITGVYGSRRILNGKPRQPHFGIDIAADEGTPVMAPAPGIVSLAERDLYYTGGTIIIDHGHGVSSTLMHLKKIIVKKGQRVARWQMVGTVGATGRVTGPHLDWRVNWFDQRCDPALLVPPMEWDK